MRISGVVIVLCAVLRGVNAAEIQPPGNVPESPGIHVLRGGTVIARPGEKIEGGVIVIRNGRIEQVGSGLAVPEGARVWELYGLTIYPGFIDPHLTVKPATNVLGRQSFEGEAFEHTAGGQGFYGVAGQEEDPGNTGPGYWLSGITPEQRVAERYAPDEKAFSEMRELGFTSGNIVPERGVIRGTSAFVTLGSEGPNKGIIKADTAQQIGFDVNSGRDDGYPRSLMGVIAAVRQAFFDAQHFAETGGEGTVNLALEALEAAGTGKMRVVIEPGSVLLADRAARVASELGLDFALVASGQEWRRPELMKEAGARLIVPLHFPEVPKLPEADDWSEVSLDNLRAWDWAPENAAILRKQGLEIALTTYGLSERKTFRKNLRLAVQRGLNEDDALAALTIVPATICGVEKEVGTIEAGKLANLTVVEGSYFAPTNKVRDVWVRGRAYRVNPAGRKLAEQERKSGAEKSEVVDARATRSARSPQEGRGALAEPAAVLVRGATIWTCGENGRVIGDLLVVDGKVAGVGKDLEAPEGAAVIDGTGKHVTPGLIDCHSHAMIIGNVNEATLPSTAMVRVGDVVNSETKRILEQLAGGLTVANLLHGSANPIGGQNCVIKLKDGASPEELKLKGAPAGIKFALGENVKQANWGQNRTNRFPQTRMGVPVFMENRFLAAREYLTNWANFEQGTGKRPKRDLELETLGEILHGNRLIHCHSYRQDEILVFLRTMEKFGIKVGTLQHVLEGYKVADEIAAHGAGASAFSDWWAYKYEVIDAIPYAGAVMHKRGVLVSFNSDSGDLARRLNAEAAKAVKYGGLPEEEALKLVTLNPAKQLQIEKRVGSLDVGKDGDFAIWSGPPLDARSRCLETWIEGKRYFDAAAVPERAKRLAEEREQLMVKAKKSPGSSRGDEGSSQAEAAFFTAPYELWHENEDRHCDAH